MKRLMTKYAILLLSFPGALAGCVKDNAAPQSDGENPVKVFVMSPASRAGETSDPKAIEGDYDIVDFRVMVFKYGGGDLVRNTYVEDIWDTDPENRIEILDIMTGVYDFLFIANEKGDAADGELHTRLNAYDPDGNQKYRLADVLQESFPHTCFSADRPIPMTALYRNVAVSGDNTLTYTEGGVPRQLTGAVWPVQVQRLGIRLDIELKTNLDELKNNIAGLTIRVPKKVYLINDKGSAVYTYPNNAGVIAEATTEIAIPYGDTEGVFTSDGKPYVWTLPRIILPENTFNPSSDDDRVIRIGAHFDGNLSSLYGSVALDREGGDYTAPRNYIYNLTGILRDAIRFEGTVAPWEEGEQPEIDLSDPIARLEPESNCYVVEPDSDPIGIPISLLKDSRLSPHIDASVLNSDLSDFRADVLWSDTPGNGRGIGENAAVRAVRFVNTGTFEKSYIMVTPGNVEGNAVVMLYKDNGNGSYHPVGDIIGYSWHIWVSADRQTILAGKEGIHGSTGEPLYWMDRNLGAKYNRYEASDEAGVMGLLYQYGRKDPFPASTGFSGANQTTTKPVYGLQEISAAGSGGNISESIKNPFRFYSSAPHWFSGFISSSVWFDPNATSSNAKSVFDPCPHGWSIPRDIPWGDDDMDDTWSSVSYGYSNENFGGYYPRVTARAGYGLVFLMAGYWGVQLSQEPTDMQGSALALDLNDNPGSGTSSKVLGLNIRCVKTPL